MKLAKEKAYGVEAITVRDAMDGVRSHPGMYLGNIDAKGTYQIFKEVADNAGPDELSNCRTRKMSIVIDKYGVTVADSGRGIPLEIHKTTKLSGVETVFTKLHAGAKSGNKAAYGNTIGVHGVGASVTNALSDSFEVWTAPKGVWYHIAFKHGKTVSRLQKAKPPIKMHKTGTVVRYRRDEKILPDALDSSSVKTWCRLASHFHAIDIWLTIGGKQIHYPAKTPEDLLKRMLNNIAKSTGDDTVLDTLLPSFSFDAHGVRCILTWTTQTDSFLETFVVGSPTIGGTHVTGFKEALFNAFQTNFKKNANDAWDWTIGLVAILDVSIDQPSFEGQNKTRLATRAATKLVRDTLEPELTKFIRKHKDKAAIVIEHVSSVSQAISDAKEKIKVSSKVSNTSRNKSNLPSKLVSVPHIAPERRELYIVEGDSAAGTASQARLSDFQEVLPIRGKIPNVITDGRKAYTNEEILDIITSCGYVPKDPTKKGRIGKLIFLCDADTDGGHIATLLLTMVHKQMPEYFEQGKVFLVEGPLFIGKVKGIQVYGDKLADLGKGADHVELLKGWGSCSSKLLRTLAFEPKTRKMFQIVVPKGKDKQREHKAFEALMGKLSRDRKILMGFPVTDLGDDGGDGE